MKKERPEEYFKSPDPANTLENVKGGGALSKLKEEFQILEEEQAEQDAKKNKERAWVEKTKKNQPQNPAPTKKPGYLSPEEYDEWLKNNPLPEPEEPVKSVDIQYVGQIQNPRNLDNTILAKRFKNNAEGKPKPTIKELRAMAQARIDENQALTDKMKKLSETEPDFSKLLIEDVRNEVVKGKRFYHTEGENTITYVVDHIEKTKGGKKIVLKGTDDRMIQGSPAQIAKFLASGYLAPETAEHLVKNTASKAEQKKQETTGEQKQKTAEPVEPEDMTISPSYEDLTEWHLDENTPAEPASEKSKQRRTKEENQAIVDARLAEIAAEDAEKYPGLSKEEITEQKKKLARGELIEAKKSEIAKVIGNKKEKKDQKGLITIDVEAEDVTNEAENAEEEKDPFKKLGSRAEKGFDHAKERLEHLEERYRELFASASEKYKILADSFLKIKAPEFAKELKEQHERNTETFEKKFAMQEMLKSQTLSRLERLATENLSENKIRSIGYAIDTVFNKIKIEDEHLKASLDHFETTIDEIPSLQEAHGHEEKVMQSQMRTMAALKGPEHFEEFVVEFGDLGEIAIVDSPEMKLLKKESAPMVEARIKFEKAVNDAEVKPVKRNFFERIFGVGDATEKQRNGKAMQAESRRQIDSYAKYVPQLEERINTFAEGKADDALSEKQLREKHRMLHDLVELKRIVEQENKNYAILTKRLENYAKR